MISKLRAVRAGQRSAVTRLLKRLDEENTDSEDIETILDTLTEKQEVLRDLDEKILTETAEEETEKEILETDEYNLNLNSKMRKFKKQLLVQKSSLNATATSYSHHNENSQFGENGQSSHNFSENSRAISFHSNSNSSNSSNFHKLPKLNLPIFEGNILEWQSFWDSFDSAIHSNNMLTEVQKFNYLKSLVEGEASNTIAGFALTHANYNRAIELLHERFGQKHKIIQSYMQALLDLPAPKNNLKNLRHFHDQVETYVRGLESYGQAQETYGSLLVPVILNKLPSELRKNLAREHGSTNWLLGDLRNSLYRELEILEAGASIDATEPSATAIFYIHSKSSDEKVQQNYSPQKHQVCCAFCKESHYSYNCTRYKKHNDRMKIVKRDKLCFNCLGKHRVADCQSRFNCKICKRRHHTSLCTVHDVVKTEMVNTPTLQAKAELDAKTREIKNLQGHLESSKNDIAKLEQQIKEQKILNERTIKDVNFLHIQFAKLQSAFDAQLITSSKLTAEKQAQITELKRKDIEVDKLKQEIQRLNIPRETPQRKLQQVGEKSQSDVEQQRETFTDHITGLKRELEAAKKLAEVDKKNLKQNIQNYREETQEKMNIIYRLEKERDHFINEANNLTQNYTKDKVHNMQIDDYKKISEDDTKISQQHNLYEVFSDYKNTHSKNLVESQDTEIKKMKRKVNIMDQQIDQLKEEIQAKENAFIKEYFEHQNAYADKDKENFKSELNHLTANKAFSTQHQAIQHFLETLFKYTMIPNPKT